MTDEVPVRKAPPNWMWPAVIFIIGFAAGSIYQGITHTTYTGTIGVAEKQPPTGLRDAEQQVAPEA